MKLSRRTFLQAATASTLAGLSIPVCRAATPRVTKPELDRILEAPVLRTDYFRSPVTVASLELLKQDRTYLIRTRSTDGLEVVTVPNPTRMAEAFPILLKNVIPVFVKKDARTLEHLLWEVYRHGSNYKLQGIALWASVAEVEMALLELLGQTAQRPVADLFGGAQRQEIPVYYASGNRGNRPEEEIAYLQKLVAGSGVRALKFRLGGRMSRNADSLPGRTETLIPLVRQTFGDDFTLYADSNSSYDVPNAIERAHGN